MRDIIAVNNLGKKYKIYPNKWSRILEWLTSSGKLRHEEFWTLQNLNFSVSAGESIGIIGRNGAGKSTLLKILTGTTQPTTGSAMVNGRVAALLELGMGFHPDLTGRQNAYVTGQLLGLSNEQISALMPEIESFAEIGDYMDQPLRTYSSGMVVRVAFAASTAVRPEILIVDEALSVGDAYFQHKCFNRIKRYREEGTTLLFVSHDPGAVKSLCDRAVLLDKGILIKDGRPDEVLDYYNAVIAKQEAEYAVSQSQGKGERLSTRSGNGSAKIKEVSILSEGKKANAVQVGDQIEVRVTFKCLKELVNPTVGFVFKDRLGNEIFGTNSYYHSLDLGECAADSMKTIAFKIPANFGVGHYSLTVALHEGSNHINNSFDWWDQAYTLQVIAGKEPSFVGSNYIPVDCDYVKSKLLDEEV